MFFSAEIYLGSTLFTLNYTSVLIRDMYNVAHVYKLHVYCTTCYICARLYISLIVLAFLDT
jgi:hypothetical protein